MFIRSTFKKSNQFDLKNFYWSEITDTIALIQLKNILRLNDAFNLPNPKNID